MTLLAQAYAGSSSAEDKAFYAGKLGYIVDAFASARTR